MRKRLHGFGQYFSVSWLQSFSHLLIVAGKERQNIFKDWFKSVYERIFILVWIEYWILFASAKLSESNSEYYSCCKIYSNNIRIVQNIRIFEYFWIILKDKIKKLKNNNSQKYFSWNLKTGHQGVEKNWILTIEIFVKLSFHVKKMNLKLSKSLNF